MYKLLIVDDEYEIRNGLRNKFDWNQLGFETPLIAGDGEEALVIIASQKPHVVMSDIRMPNKDGLELLKEIKYGFPYVKTVILSGYNDFEYARKGMQYGASGYILKPTSNDEINSIFKKIHDDLINEEKQLSELSTLKSNNDEYMNMKKYSCLRDLILGRINSFGSDTDDLHSLKLDLYTEKVCCAVFSLHEVKEADKRNLLEQIRFDHATTFGTSGVKFEILSEENDRLVLVMTGDSYVQSRELILATEKVWNCIRDTYEFSVSCGIGNVYTGMRNLCRSYNEADKALKVSFIDGLNRIYLSNNYNLEKPSADHVDELNRLEHHCMENICSGNICSAKETIVKYFNKLKVIRADIDSIHERCIRLVALIKSSANITDLKYEQDSPSILDFSKIDTFEQLRNTVEEYCLKIADLVHIAAERDNNSPIRIVMDFVDKNYRNSFSLKDISKLVFMNPTYFSIYFKEKAGRNFSDYITDVRINHAKMLLGHSRFKVNEIAEQVGYSDSTYFCNLFKKMTEMTPLEYRKKIVLGEIMYEKA